MEFAGTERIALILRFAHNDAASFVTVRS